MWKKTQGAASAFVLALTSAGVAHAADLDYDNLKYYEGQARVYKAHSVDDAYGKLHRHGYNDIRVQRASEPYSFIACKRGQRYHIHLNYYGDFEQVDQVGYCGDRYARGYRKDDDGYDYRSYRRRHDYGYDDAPRYWGYRRARDYY